jgi:predicted dehydrogenase
MISLDFDNPYLQNAPTELHRKHGQTELISSTEIPSYEESFKIEAKRFTDAIKTGEKPRTTFSEASADVRLIADIVRRATGKEPVQS